MMLGVKQWPVATEKGSRKEDGAPRLAVQTKFRSCGYTTSVCLAIGVLGTDNSKIGQLRLVALFDHWVSVKLVKSRYGLCGLYVSMSDY
jgi:hypothetical protein